MERDVAALAESAAVVRELHPHLMASRRDRRIAADAWCGACVAPGA